jgi:hypothetical protein
MGKITVKINGQPQDFEANYLDQERLEAWQGFIFERAWGEFKPFADFLARFTQLSPQFQALANVRFREALLHVHEALAAVQFLGVLVCGEDFVTAANADEAYPQLAKFITRPEEIVCNSIEEANAIRAAVGKPPTPAILKPPPPPRRP